MLEPVITFDANDKSMRLPKLGDSIQYHVLHTLMCHPEDLALHHKMLEDAYNKSKQGRWCGEFYTFT